MAKKPIRDPETDDLEKYFTDVEYLRDLFAKFVAAEKLPKRILVIHGVGGVGKSSLLRMFRLHCKSEKIPVALASGDDTKSILDVLARWTEDLKTGVMKFATFSKSFEHYRTIQAKVDEQAKKTQDARGRMADIAGKAASKTAETASGALLGAAIGSIIPGVGTAIGGSLGGVLGGMGAEALVDWLRGFLTKPDIDLLLDPSKRLTTDFLEDLAKSAEKNRIVILLDTFEQMTTLEDWVGDVAQKIHVNVLLVIAGRKLPDWNRLWPGWMTNAQVEELKPMTEEIMRQLIRRYYATMRGGEPEPTQVEAIIRFARGLPMVVTSAVQLWVKYGVEDFQSVKVEIVANLVDRLMEGVPDSLIPALEAAAVVRWFDQPILRAVMKQEDVRDIYNELRRFPFVRTRIEGLALHDSVREMMDENLRVQDSERHSELHERAAAYFEKRLEKITGEETERLSLERLYHHVRVDEGSGIKLFQEMAEELTKYRLANRLRALLNDANSYPLERENSKLWREYYSARLLQIKLQVIDAERIYQEIGASKNVEPKLHAYALCDWGWILHRRENLRMPGEEERTVRVLKSCLNTGVPIDSKLATAWICLSSVCVARAEWELAFQYLEHARDFFDSTTDYNGNREVLRHELGIHGRKGDFREVIKVQEKIRNLFKTAGEPNYMKVYIKAPYEWHMMGRYYEWGKDIPEALQNARAIEDDEQVILQGRELGLALSIQDRCVEALNLFEEIVALQKQMEGDALTLGKFILLSNWGSGLVRCGDFSKAEKILMEGMEIANKIRAHLDIAPRYLGVLREISQQWDEAEAVYEISLTDARSIQRNFYICAALTGLARVKHAQGNIAAISPLLVEAEQLAQKYEYNDHLASLRLTQGHLAWEKGNQDEATAFYQKAMIYALRYNRFLLDELISGRPQGTPLRPIITFCLERGEDGRKILMALLDWWKSGNNDIGSPRPDTISPIPEGIPLLEAEKIAREREPGDGATQKTVLEQLETAIKNSNKSGSQ